MSKTIKTLFLISFLLFTILESASSSRLRALQTESETSFNLEETDNPTTTTDTSDSFVLGEGSPEENPENPDHAANYDLGDADASQAPAPTTSTSTLVGASATIKEVPVGATSFVLGDDNDSQTVPNTQNNDETTSESHDFDLGEEDNTVGVSTSASAGETSFDLNEDEHTDHTVGASAGESAGETSFDLNEDDNSVGASASTSTSAGETSFELKEEDDTVGASAGGEASFDLTEDNNDDNTVGASASTSTSAGESSFELTDEKPGDVVGASNPETSFELTDEDNTNNVDLTDPADESSSTDKTGANNGGRALSSNENVTVTTTAKAGVSLQTGLVLSLVAVVSALML